MSLIILLIAGLLAVAVPDRSALNPFMIATVTGTPTEPVECRPESPSESSGGTTLNQPGPSRTANFSLTGQYKCSRPVFAANERDPYINLVLNSELPRAKRIAEAVKSAAGSRGFGEPLGLAIEGIDDPKLRETLRALYANELTNVLGASSVARLPPVEDSHQPALKIRFARVSVPELLSRATVYLPEKKEWVEL